MAVADHTPVSGFLKAEKRPAGRFLSLATGAGATAGLLLILQAWCLARIADGVVFRQQTMSELTPWLIGLSGALVLRGILAYVAEMASFKAAASIKLGLRRRLFAHVQRLGPLYLTGERTGDMTTVIIDGIEALEAYYARYLPAMALAALTPLAILAFVLPMDWVSAVVMMVTAPLIPFFMILIGKGAERLNQRQWKALARMGGHFLDTIQGLTTLKLFNASRREAEVIARISDDYRRSTMGVLRVAFLSALVLEFFSTVSIAIVAVLIGFRLLYGEMDFGPAFFVLLLAPEYYLPLRNLGSHYHTRMDAIAAAERIVGILDTPVQAAPVPLPDRPLPAGPLKITATGLHYAYEPGRDALKDVSFTLAPGEHIALVGASGAGKSTLVNLLLGFVRPDDGRLLVDGHSVDEYGLDQWRSRLAWVPQRPRLFHGSVADNIRLGRPDASDEEVAEAARFAFADEFIDRLPEHMDTLVGEGGRGLSGGQIQRLALARAFVRSADLVIMDEPTAHLDMASEDLVHRATEQLARGRSMLVVAHRLRSVMQADRVLVMDRGRIVEQGSHDDLLAQKGLYRRLVETQGLGQ